MSSSWCSASTRRLLTKLAQHKPAGVSRHFHLMCLVDLLNHIYEDENDIIFEDYLSDEHIKELKVRGSFSGSKLDLKVFPPSYIIRPTAAQIEDKLNELYGMKIINENEIFPEEIFKQRDFELPDYVLNIPSISDEMRNTNSLTSTSKRNTSKARNLSGARSETSNRGTK